MWLYDICRVDVLYLIGFFLPSQEKGWYKLISTSLGCVIHLITKIFPTFPLKGCAEIVRCFEQFFSSKRTPSYPWSVLSSAFRVVKACFRCLNFLVYFLCIEYLFKAKWKIQKLSTVFFFFFFHLELSVYTFLVLCFLFLFWLWRIWRRLRTRLVSLLPRSCVHSCECVFYPS